MTIYRIAAVEFTNYKNLRRVSFEPAADSYAVLICGKNGAGKSSMVDAFTALFGGAKAVATDPVRHGEKESALYAKLEGDDGSTLTLDRTIAPDGKTQLEVRDAEGAIRRPQEMLDKLVAARALDPLSFMRLSPKDQRAQLMKLIPDAARIDELDAKRVRAFDRRREIGQDLTKAKGELARLAEVPVGELVDVAALTAEQRAFSEQQRSGEAAGALVDRLERDTVVANDRLGGVLTQIEDLKRALAQLEGRVPELEAELKLKRGAADTARANLETAGVKWKETQPRRDELDAALATANERNQAVFEARAQNKRRVEAAAAVAKLDADYETCSTTIGTIDARKAGILGAAKLPVEGLEIAEDGIKLAGVPFAQASASEQLRVALALAIAGSPGLNDVWIRDGALLDDESLERVVKHVASAGKRLWIEIVGERKVDDAAVLLIQDGQVAA